MASITSRISLSARRTESSRGGFMSLAVRLFVIDYAFIHSSGKKRQQNFPPRSVFFWVLMVSWRLTGSIVIRSLCPLCLSSGCVDDAVIGIYNAAGAVIETHEYASDFKEW